MILVSNFISNTVVIELGLLFLLPLRLVIVSALCVVNPLHLAKRFSSERGDRR